MSYYVYSTSLPYSDYLQAKSFVDEVADGSRAVRSEVARQSREIVATLEELNERGIRVADEARRELTGLRADVREGFEQVTLGLEGMSKAIDDLNATFHWGFSRLISGVGRMSDTLEELVALAKTPSQTWAYEQFEIARDALRRQLYREALAALDRAINGKGDNVGYALEWRFHHLKGVILLGDVDTSDPALVDLGKAEEAFATASRYAKTDYRTEAALAALAAGWAAYCQGKMEVAGAHTQQAITLNPSLAEALFQAAKIKMHTGQVDSALQFLRSAIAADRNYSVKAAADGDFQKHSDRLNGLLDECRSQARDAAEKAIQIAYTEIETMKEWHVEEAAQVEYGEAIKNLPSAQESFSHQTFYGYLDAMRCASIAAESATSATEAQKNRLKQLAAATLDEALDLQSRIVEKAREHSPSALAEAQEKVKAAGDCAVPGHSYEECAHKVNRACSALSSLREVESLSLDRAEKCRQINARNKELPWNVGLTAGIAVAFVVAIWAITAQVAAATNMNGLTRGFYVLGSLIADVLVCGVVGGGAFIVAYFLVRAGVGQKPLPPKH